MIGVAQVRERARGSVGRHLGAWAASIADGSGGDAVAVTDVVTVPLGPPTERQMLADERAAEAWAREWAEFVAPAGVEVEWETRSWRSIGRQRVPVRVRMHSGDAVAAVGGGPTMREWTTVRARASDLAQRLGSSPELGRAVKKHCARLAGYDDIEFAQVAEVSEWVARHPVTGLRPRQVPVRGVDSKWLGRHRAVVRDLVAAVTGSDDLGLVDSDPLVRVRILDADLTCGLRDFAAPPVQLESLNLEPRGVIVLENLETVLAMPDLDGAVVVHGGGFAVDLVAALPWVSRVPVLYWGDLDSHGFAILHRLRSRHPVVTSVLMDEATLLGHHDLWVPEPAPTRAAFPTLTADEHATLARLRTEGDVRLEQERLPWSQSLAALTAAWRDLMSPR